jgi:hypothetical protein
VRLGHDCAVVHSAWLLLSEKRGSDKGARGGKARASALCLRAC